VTVVPIGIPGEVQKEMWREARTRCLRDSRRGHRRYVRDPGPARGF